jgi:5'-nucleotidase
MFFTSRKPLVFAFACALSSLATMPAHALNIVLTNDDGFESASLHAIYQRLEASGHSVVITAPVFDATAQGGGITIGRPIPALPAASRGGAIAANAPGVGALKSDPDVHYVNGSPVMSMLYGLDVVARRKWGKAPDLVVSGVNYGLNVGRSWSGSGTVGAAVAALGRGVPAVAVSADFSPYVPVQQLRAGAREYELADFVVRLVRALELTRPTPDAPLLPRMLGLNVNFPNFAAGRAATLPLKLSRPGSAADRITVFVENMQREWPEAGLFMPPSPGIAYLTYAQLPASIARIEDDDPLSEGNVVKQGGVAVTVVQAHLQPNTPWSADAVGARILAQLSTPPAPSTPVSPAPTDAGPTPAASP